MQRQLRACAIAALTITTIATTSACGASGNGADDAGTDVDGAPLDGGVDPGDGTPPPDDGAIPDTAGPVCTGLATGLSAAPRSYALPAARCGSKFDALGKTGALSYSLLDLTADGAPDLVVSRDTCATDVGRARWDVYAGGESGFSASPTAYSLPAPRCANSFDAPGKTGALGYALLDLLGDARPDLVVFKDGCDATVGADHWDVYVGGDAGFAAGPSRFGLPAPRCASKFDAMGKTGALSYALLDLGADGRPDLVVHRDECDASIGAARWDVYAAGATSFAAAPTPYALPTARCKTKFDALASGYGALTYSLLDVSADGRPDLVVSNDDCDPAIGDARWDVYGGGATGFTSAPSAYALPTARCSTKFDALAKTYGELDFGLLDLSCDRRAELVVSSDACDTMIGSARWDVYAGGASGFQAAPVSFSLPAPRCKTSFDGFAKNGGIDYALLTLGQGSSGGRPSLVVYQDSCDATLGATHWDIYPSAP